MSGAVPLVAGAIRWPVAVLLVWISGATLAAAERCQRLELGLLQVEEGCTARPADAREP